MDQINGFSPLAYQIGVFRLSFGKFILVTRILLIKKFILGSSVQSFINGLKIIHSKSFPAHFEKG